jgi:hypothetical protein
LTVSISAKAGPATSIEIRIPPMTKQMSFLMSYVPPPFLKPTPIRFPAQSPAAAKPTDALNEEMGLSLKAR